VIDVPVLHGPWWRIAGDDPDVSPYTYVENTSSNTCDFTIFKDRYGTWRLIACVRGTSAPGQRVFHHWTSDQLNKPDWRPEGLFEAPRGLRGGQPTSQQAPHGFCYEDKWYMFYNSGSGARAQVSDDGAGWKDRQGNWSVLRNTDGSDLLFPIGRDVCLFHDPPRNRWMAHYCGTAGDGASRHGAMVARTAPSLRGPWSPEELLVRDGGNPESPCVLQYNGHYYLWQQMSVFASDTPERFAGPPIQHMTGLCYSGRYAPEIVVDHGQYYLAGYGGGVWVAKMKWISKTAAQIEQWRSTELARMQREREAADKRRAAAAGTHGKK